MMAQSNSSALVCFDCGGSFAFEGQYQAHLCRFVKTFKQQQQQQQQLSASPQTIPLQFQLHHLPSQQQQQQQQQLRYQYAGVMSPSFPPLQPPALPPTVPMEKKVKPPRERIPYLYISSYSDLQGLDAGCSFSLTDGITGKVLGRQSFVVKQYYHRSLQPEYEALCEGFMCALKFNIPKIKVITVCELLYLHLQAGKVPLWFQTCYRVVESFFPNLQQLLSRFESVGVELVRKKDATDFNKNSLNTLMHYRQNKEM